MGSASCSQPWSLSESMSIPHAPLLSGDSLPSLPLAAPLHLLPRLCLSPLRPANPPPRAKVTLVGRSCECCSCSQAPRGPRLPLPVHTDIVVCWPVLLTLWPLDSGLPLAFVLRGLQPSQRFQTLPPAVSSEPAVPVEKQILQRVKGSCKDEEN